MTQNTESAEATRTTLQFLARKITPIAFLTAMGDWYEEQVNAAFDVLAEPLASGAVEQIGGAAFAHRLERVAGLYPYAGDRFYEARSRHVKSLIPAEYQPVVSIVEALMDVYRPRGAQTRTLLLGLLQCETIQEIRSVAAGIPDAVKDHPNQNDIKTALTIIASESWSLPPGAAVELALAPFLSVYEPFFIALRYEEEIAT